MSNAEKIVVVGTGRMAEAYISALRFIGVSSDNIVVVSRTIERAAALSACHGTRYQKEVCDRFRAAIVAVTPDRSPEVCRSLVAGGTKALLVEKPGALSSSELFKLAVDIEFAGAKAYMALNRRFFNSVIQARELIAADGGAVALNFEFTDLEAHVLALRAEPAWSNVDFARWGLINPVHVIDLAFYLCGAPADLLPRRAGALSWHPTGSEFCGVGQTSSGSLFSYWAAFSGVGRWRVDVATRHRRLVLSPLETLQQQLPDSFELKPVELDPEPADQKTGLVRIVSEFLRPQGVHHVPTVREMANRLAVVEQIFGYVERDDVDRRSSDIDSASQTETRII